jgi:H+/Cl- antiporter ClcA
MTGLLSPTMALGAVLSTAYAALFHLWQDGDTAALRHYLLAAWLGFAAGHLLGNMLSIQMLQVGQLNVVGGTVGTVIALLIAKALEE